MSIKNNFEKTNTDPAFEAKFLKSLRSYGFIFPSTEEEVENFESEYGEELELLPDFLESPIEILRRGRIQKELNIIHKEDQAASDNLGQAAREGKKLSEEIMKKMREDRLREQNKRKNK